MSVDVVTVTPDPAIDWTLTVPHFTLGTVNRVEAARSRPAGKGVNVAAALAASGLRVTATGWLGVANASAFEAFFAERGIADHFVRMPGETLSPPPAERSQLMERVLGLAVPDRWIVMSGSLPPGVDPGFYCELSTLAAGAGARVLIDTSGAPLRRALRSEPHVLKPNRGELEALVGRALESRADIESAARGLLKGATEMVVVSLAAEGALFVTSERVIAAAPPAVPVGSAAGAGDAMVAGIVAARIRELDLEGIARLASAFALEALTGEPADGWMDRIALSDGG